MALKKTDFYDFFLLLLIALGICALIFSCTSEPEASIYIDYSNAGTSVTETGDSIKYFKVREPVHFSAAGSIDADWYDWDTGDCPHGNFLYGSATSRTYYCAGTYTVTLTAHHHGRQNVTQAKIVILK